MADPRANPYVGPRPFERGDRGVFFGRDGEARELLSLVVSERVVLLYAASGAGKTSLLHAALAPLLEEEEGFEVLPVARLQAALGEDALATARNVYALGLLVGLGWDGERDPPPLKEFLAARPHRVGADGFAAPRALVIDQFEELFTLYPRYWRQRPQFVEELADALEADPLLRVVLAMREDHVAQLDPYADLFPRRLRARFRLERLGPDAAIAAVVNPTRGTPRTYAPGVAEKLVTDLLRFRADTGRGETIEIEGEYVEPVQLQVACQSLWDELPPDVTDITEDHLRTFGDVDEVLRRFYENAVRAAAARAHVREPKLRALLEDSVVTAVGTRNTVYRRDETTGGIPNAAIDELEDHHVIRAEWRAGARWYELTHDRLIAPIQTSNARFREKLARRRRRRVAVAAVALVLAAAAIAAVTEPGSRGASAPRSVELSVTDTARVGAHVRVTGQVAASGLTGSSLGIFGAVVSADGRPVSASTLQSTFIPESDLETVPFTVSAPLPRRDGSYHVEIVVRDERRETFVQKWSAAFVIAGGAASIAAPVEVDLHVTGPGRVAFGKHAGPGATQYCPPACSATFPAGTEIAFRALPAREGVLVRSGVCARGAPSCVVRVRTATSASAVFGTVIGRTRRGTQLVAAPIGRLDAPRKLLVIGCIRSTACAGTAVADALLARPAPSGAVIWVIRDLDPDGVTTDEDLNHDFPCDWAPGSASDEDTGGCRGRNALTQPESRGAAALVRRLDPDLTIWYFSRSKNGDPSFRPARWVARPAASGQLARKAAAAYARLVGYGPAVDRVSSSRGPVILEDPGGNYGSGTAWQQHMKPPMTTFWVELPRAITPAEAERHAAAILAIARG